MTGSAAAALFFVLLVLVGCDSRPASLSAANGSGGMQLAAESAPQISPPDAGAKPSYLGFDRNDYPGDTRLAALHEHFSFAGFWLNNPPGERQNSWAGHRSQLVAAGFGFVVLWNGRLDAEIKRAQTRDKIAPDALGRQDAQGAIAAARREGFPDGTTIFLDQEEGGRLLPEQSTYFFGFTEAIAPSPFRAGSYLSGQPSDDGPGTNGKRITITTAQDVRSTIAARHLHRVNLWVAQDACPPAPGCTVDPAALAHLAPRDSGTADAEVWQYAQSPQRPELTHACAKTYAEDGNCHAGVASGDAAALYLDLNLAASPDPSHGR